MSKPKPTKVVSMRLDADLFDDVERFAKANGTTTSHYMKLLLQQGLTSQNLLAEHLCGDGDKTEKSLARIEAVVCGLLNFIVIDDGQAPTKFNEIVRIGAEISVQLEAKAAGKGNRS